MEDGGEQSPARGLPIRAIGVTLFACAAFLALRAIPLPGLSAPFTRHALLPVGYLGLTPIVSAFIAIELLAALVPGLRPLRWTAAGRARLRQTSFYLAFAIALVQAIRALRFVEGKHVLDEA